MSRIMHADDEKPQADLLLNDWTSADYDSYDVLAAIGVPEPVATVTRARQRPLSPAARDMKEVAR